jgi:cobyrinic acid a,c-diamide synthase
MHIPRLMIAAPQGRSGKTTVAIGLCAALSLRGLKVKPFKKGPDYIDPSWLTAAAGRSCTNLDTFFCDRRTLLRGFQESCVGADLAVIEASMGLYDSSSEDGIGSSAWLARQLQTPIAMVVNCQRITRSVAAMVKGYLDFEPGTRIAGVILNNVAGVRHVDTMVKSLEQHCGLPVLGALPKDVCLNIEERHMGIVPLKEEDEACVMIDRIGKIFKADADIDKILQIACTVPALPHVQSSPTPVKQSPVRIGVLADRAFSFYYPENLQALRQAGAQLFFIDSMNDKSLPDVQALYIGGGFPELYADALEANSSLRQSIAEAAEDGLPIYAECAGLMYLCRSILRDGKAYNMCGVIKADVEIEEKPQGHGYVIVEVIKDNPFFEKGETLRGHEFHHSRLVNAEDLHCIYNVRRGHGIDGQSDGILHKNVFAAYTHIHAWGVPSWARNFVRLAAARRGIANQITVQAKVI